MSVLSLSHKEHGNHWNNNLRSENNIAGMIKKKKTLSIGDKLFRQGAINGNPLTPGTKLYPAATS
jgi:hypothetical protein